MPTEAETALNASQLGVTPERARSADKVTRELEFAYFRSGEIAVGYSNATEDGGFTVLGFVTAALQAALARATATAEAEATEVRRRLDRALDCLVSEAA